jgi:hypothetical protein
MPEANCNARYFYPSPPSFRFPSQGTIPPSPASPFPSYRLQVKGAWAWLGPRTRSLSEVRSTSLGSKFWFVNVLAIIFHESHNSSELGRFWFFCISLPPFVLLLLLLMLLNLFVIYFGYDFISCPLHPTLPISIHADLWGSSASCLLCVYTPVGV